jgi:hypothetical protein
LQSDRKNNLEKRRKYFVGALMVLVLAFTLVWIQQHFNQGDEQDAFALVGAQKASQGGTVGEVLVARSASGSPDCRSTFISYLDGTLEVTCRTDTEMYRFAVDLIHKSVRPLDERTSVLMGVGVHPAHSLQADAG